MSSNHIIVLGAGIIGLQTAVTLLEEKKEQQQQRNGQNDEQRSSKYEVTVLAEHLPGDTHAHYTSPWAGAIWRTHAGAEDSEVCAWDAATYHHWQRLIEEEDRENRTGEAGIKLFHACVTRVFISGIETIVGIGQKLQVTKVDQAFTILQLLPATQYWDAVTPEIAKGVSSIWWAPVVLDLVEIPSSELPVGSIFGVHYRTFAVNVPCYLAYLRSRIEKLGGRVVRYSLPKLKTLVDSLPLIIAAAGTVDSDHASSGGNSEAKEDAARQPPLAVINATGLAAQWLVPDPDVYVIQGQTVLVRGEAKRHVARLGRDILDVNVIIPRPGSGTTVVGSSRLPNSWNTEPDEQVTRQLLDKGSQLIPELVSKDTGGFDVIEPCVGLRPYRRGGPRVEVERLSLPLPADQTVIIHAYGHAGAGYQNSVGTADKVLGLVRGLDGDWE